MCLSWKAEAQTLTYSFIDPCTKVVTYFSVPAQGTTIFFLGQSRSFVPGDVQNGTLAAWINQVYADYRKVAPCGQQQGQVTQNQITSQIIGNTVQSVVGSIMSQAQSAAAGTMQSVTTTASTSNASSAGSSDAASKNNKDGGTKKSNNENNNTSNQSNSGNGEVGNNNNTNTGSNTSGNNSSVGSGGGVAQSSTNTKKEEAKSEEVAATTTMNVDQQNQNSSKDDNSSSGGGGKGGKSGSKSGSTNPMIISSDFTTAQNLDKSFTPILNLSMSQSSMTGMSSWGLTSMIWFNFKQFALSGKYTKINFSKNGKLKWVHNINLTSVYSYGNIIGFVGYSGILNAGKWGVTGFNTSAAMTLITGDQKNTFISPSITAFYTKPFTISPELYIISTPLIYSTKEKITTTDRTFSAFIGSGFDYQLTRRFKFNMNYKANMSTNPDFPILSFFLIGSKINL
jgi:hypothetical protein